MTVYELLWRLVFPPVLAAAWWLAAEPSLLRTGLDVAALTVLVAGIFIVAKYRATIDAQNSSGQALERELVAQRERGDRLEEQLAEKETEWIRFSEEQRELRHQLKNELAAEKGKHDLSQLTRLVMENNKALSDKIGELAQSLTPNQEAAP